MAIIPAPTDQLLEISAWVEVLVVGREVVEDFRCGMDTGRREAYAFLCIRPFDEVAYNI
jgi:hypothetical protein